MKATRPCEVSTVTVTGVASAKPPASLAVPAIVGVASFKMASSAGAVSAMAGAVVSTTKVAVTGALVLFAASVATTLTV